VPCSTRFATPTTIRVLLAPAGSSGKQGGLAKAAVLLFAARRVG
jgi:hypothetical protein